MSDLKQIKEVTIQPDTGNEFYFYVGKHLDISNNKNIRK